MFAFCIKSEWRKLFRAECRLCSKMSLGVSELALIVGIAFIIVWATDKEIQDVMRRHRKAWNLWTVSPLVGVLGLEFVTEWVRSIIVSVAVVGLYFANARNLGIRRRWKAVIGVVIGCVVYVVLFLSLATFAF